MGRDHIMHTSNEYRHCAIDRPRYGPLRVELFEEANKYFNDAYVYGKQRAFQDRPKNTLSSLCARGHKIVNL